MTAPVDPNAATVRITFPDPASAEQARQSLEPDNDGHVEATVEGNDLVLSAKADSIMGLLRTLDDAMGCLRATGVE